MRPLFLKMNNFLSYEDESFDFSQVTNATITGRNGAGKSSFCTDAITWALFGKGSRGSEKESGNYVSVGANSCWVELTFSLNGSTYKVIRSVSVAKSGSSRMSLNLFVVDKDGNEIAMSGGRLGETQEKIEDLLKMSYKTFVSSSMIFQGKADEFTNGMSNAERKEALINILNIGGWEKVGEKAKAELASLKQSLRDNEANRDAQHEIASHKKEYADRKSEAEGRLKALARDKDSCEKTIEKNQKAIFQRDELGKELARKQAEIGSVNDRISRSSSDMHTQQGIIEKNNRLIAENSQDKEKQQKILGRKDAIEAAVEKERILQDELTAILEKQNKYTAAKSKLDDLNNQGKLWNTTHSKDAEAIDRQIADARKQAEALDSAPCAKDKKLSASCAFLKMAYEAKANLEVLAKKKEALAKEENPFRPLWSKQREVVNSLVVKENEARDKQAELKEVQKTSRLKPVLDGAAETIARLSRSIMNLEESNKEAKKRIEEIREQGVKDKEQLRVLEKEVEEIRKGMSAFDAVYKEQEQAKKTLEEIKQQEVAVHSEIGSCQTLLQQVKEAEETIRKLEKEVAQISSDIADTELLMEACGKNAGVPALIVENAVPELESEANAVLENMMDGRLQIRLDTQVETGKGTKLEVFRITVLDDGYERRYETYSGAEKFVVDLAIRIAMSKFLCKRSGASVSMFVLDEGVSCADENNRDEIIKAIRSIATEFETVLFVTHIEELKDALDQRIEVTKNSLGSHIRLLD